MHSRYERRLLDTAVGAQEVVICSRCTSAPGLAASHAADESDERSSRMSTGRRSGRRPAASRSAGPCAAPTRPPPAPRGDAATVGSGSARTSRISVIRLTAAANRPGRRAPGRPPGASGLPPVARSPSACGARSCWLASRSARRTSSGALPGQTKEPADGQADHHLATAGGRYPAAVACNGCAPAATPTACRAGGRQRPRPGRDPDRLAGQGNPFYLHVRQVRQQHAQGIKDQSVHIITKATSAPSVTCRTTSRKLCQSEISADVDTPAHGLLAFLTSGVRSACAGPGRAGQAQVIW